jgi:hypothetical protein
LVSGPAGRIDNGSHVDAGHAAVRAGPGALDLGLEDRYLQVEGRVYLSGMQALVRLPIDQSRRDRRADLRIGTFISGYPGCPLGGYDLALRQARASVIPGRRAVQIPALREFRIPHIREFGNS